MKPLSKRQGQNSSLLRNLDLDVTHLTNLDLDVSDLTKRYTSCPTLTVVAGSFHANVNMNYGRWFLTVY